jgi:hypothetical protein
LWQVALMLAHADQLPESAKKVLIPDPFVAAQAAQMGTPVTAFVSKKK